MNLLNCLVLCLIHFVFEVEAVGDEIWSQFGSEGLQNVAFEEKATFSYDDRDQFGPSKWREISSFCDGTSQSPVSLYSNLAEKVQAQPLRIQGFDIKPANITVANTGHSVGLKFNFKNGKPIILSGGPLEGSYILDNIHWHWGRKDNEGSEHVLDGRRYSAEVHLVTYSSAYQSLTEAVQQPNGLAVLGFLYNVKISLLPIFGSIQGGFNPFIPLVSRVIEPKSTYTETTKVFSLREIIKTNEFNYLSYKGSLTTPGCFETVTWMISTKTIKISHRELAQFRRIKDEKQQPLLENFRPLQKLNNRRVNYY